jgi:hypothetical protein
MDWCDIPLNYEDGDDSSSALVPTLVHGNVGASLGGGSLQDHQTIMTNFGTQAPGQSKVFEASLLELHLGRESSNATHS